MISTGFSIVFTLLYTFFLLAFYVYSALCLMSLAKKTTTPNGWMAWIPILNLYLMCKVAGKSGAWLLLFLIPVVSFIALILIWMAIAERCGKSGWWGVLIVLIPVVGLVMMGVLAFSKGYAAPITAPVPPTGPQAPAPGPPGGGKFCPQCGTPIGPADRFCPDCGAKL